MADGLVSNRLGLYTEANAFIPGKAPSSMIQYKAGYKFVDGGVHAQVVDFPAAITCADNLTEARRLLAAALLDVAETRLELGQSLPAPNPQATDPEMDFEEPIYLHLSASSDVAQLPAGEVAS
jgi:predicted RNase H-like HicB family nuclease